MSVPRFRTSSFYNGFGSFKAAFPTLFDASIDWQESKGPDDTPSTRNRRKMGFRTGNFNRGLVNCGNTHCWEGGYQVDRLIEEMIQLGETEREGTLYCSGRELTEEAHRATRCRNRISYAIRLSHRDGDEQRSPASQRRASGGRRPGGRRSGGRQVRSR